MPCAGHPGANSFDEGGNGLDEGNIVRDACGDAHGSDVGHRTSREVCLAAHDTIQHMLEEHVAREFENPARYEILGAVICICKPMGYGFKIQRSIYYYMGERGGVLSMLKHCVMECRR